MSSFEWSPGPYTVGLLSEKNLLSEELLYLRKQCSKRKSSLECKVW